MQKKLVALALQGGGSHGAFTWGVLDRLLEDERISIEGISGASAGAINAVALAHGFIVGGREGARQALCDFWEKVASKAPFAYMADDLPTLVADGTPPGTSHAFKALVSLGRFFSPYELNPFDINPLRDIIASQVDFERLRAECPIKLFIATTQVCTGRLRIFRNPQLTLEALLASACVPTLHKPIDIEGEPCWDGGLTANPPLFPLIHQCTARDVIVVLLHPSRRPDVPATADAIWQRLVEIGFTSTFFTELHGVVLAKQEAEHGRFAWGRLERKLRRLNMHIIENEELMAQLSHHSRMNAHPTFINALREEGRSRADVWLKKKFQFVGARSSFRLGRFAH